KKPPWYLFNGHWETVIPSAFYKIEGVTYDRERLELPDGDFIDLDWVTGDPSQLVIISHGLEGNSERHYVKRAAKFFAAKGWSVLAWNCRSCSGHMNRLPRFYHHGDTPDLISVIEHAIDRGFERIALLGVSMGGSMTLKYLGEAPGRHEQVYGAVTFSVPCNLKDSAEQLLVKGNRFYEKRFLNKLKKKILLKSETHGDLDVVGLEEIDDFESFHRRYTVPLHGFSDLEDFYEKATCDQYLPYVSVPTLIANAWNDPLLGEKCYPKHLAADSPAVFLEIPNRGGHVGFTVSGDAYSWMEYRAWEFFSEIG
ncbi:MAG: alpha/beta hydrolase, partial [Bacteroidota bacterium]